MADKESLLAALTGAQSSEARIALIRDLVRREVEKHVASIKIGGALCVKVSGAGFQWIVQKKCVEPDPLPEEPPIKPNEIIVDGLCCSIYESSLCDEINAHVGPARVASGDKSGQLVPDAQSNGCCRHAKPAFWWAAPPASLTDQLSAEDLWYEIWASSPTQSSCEYCADNEPPEFAGTTCSLIFKVKEFQPTGETRQPSPSQAAGGYQAGPTVERDEWTGEPEPEKCCKRWPNFFLVAVARSGTQRTLATCNPIWEDYSANLCEEWDPEPSPCKCGLWEECLQCPTTAEPLSPVATVATDNGTFNFTLSSGGPFTDGCECPDSSWVGNAIICGLNHTMILCHAIGGGYDVVIYQQTENPDPDRELSFVGSQTVQACGNPNGEYPGTGFTGSLCEIDPESIVVTVA